MGKVQRLNGGGLHSIMVDFLQTQIHFLSTLAEDLSVPRFLLVALMYRTATQNASLPVLQVMVVARVEYAGRMIYDRLITT